MTGFLIRHFIRDPEDVHNETVRLAYGNLSSWTGIFCNVFLFLLKLIIGLAIHSISIMSDGFNNLSDCMSCIITLFGYRLSAKPADKEHPFGHGRMEYVVSFIVSILIFVVGWQLFLQSFQKILHPEEVKFSIVLFVILAASILVKVWMASFNMKLGRKIDNLAMMAAGADARNDVLSTAISLGALALGALVPDVPFDGIAGIIVSIFIFYSGYEISRSIITRLLGSPASEELTDAIRKQMLSHPEILGVHDMIIHDYGPGVQIGSAHAEVNAHMNFMAAHDVIDRAEDEIAKKLHVMMTIHLDPIVIDDPETNSYRERTEKALHAIDPSLSMHDFRMVSGPTHNNLVFDVLVPFGFPLSNEEIQRQIEQNFTHDAKTIHTVIHFDHGFIQEDSEDEE